MAPIRYYFALLIVVVCVSSSFSKPRITPRIYGGSLAEPYQFPFIISFRAKYWDNSFTHVCGGTIISSKLVLTAAHCTKSHGLYVKEYRVYYGAYGRFDGYECQIKRFIPHHSNNPLSLENDLMFVELIKPIRFTYCVQPAKLHREKLTNGVRVLTAGWGKTNDRSTSLKVIELETITNFQCRAKLTEITSNPPVHKNVMCAYSGNIGEGICDGDSGGPLVTDDYKLVGVSSWAFGCAKGYPDGFQRISSFIEWIDEIMASVEEN